MNIANIAGQLTPVKNSITINERLFNGIFKEVLSQNCQIEELQINKAKLITDDSLHVTVTGECNFMQCTNLPVTAWFYTNSDGIVTGKIKIELISDQRPSKPWCFSKSFSQLPKDINYADKIDINSISTDTPAVAKQNFLDSLYLYSSAFIICTQDLNKDDEGYEYTKGLNFYSKMRPDSSLGIMEKTLNSVTELNIFGHINIPLSDKKNNPSFITRQYLETP